MKFALICGDNTKSVRKNDTTTSRRRVVYNLYKNGMGELFIANRQ